MTRSEAIEKYQRMAWNLKEAKLHLAEASFLVEQQERRLSEFAFNYLGATDLVSCNKALIARKIYTVEE